MYLLHVRSIPIGWYTRNGTSLETTMVDRVYKSASVVHIEVHKTRKLRNEGAYPPVTANERTNHDHAETHVESEPPHVAQPQHGVHLCPLPQG